MATTIVSIRKRKTVSCGIKRERHLENEAIEKTSVKHNWQRIYEREHQSMTCLRAEVDDMDSYRSLVSTLWCVFIGLGSMRHYDILCNYAVVHVLKMIVCSCCAMFLKEINVRSTFNGGRSSYIVV